MKPKKGRYYKIQDCFGTWIGYYCGRKGRVYPYSFKVIVQSSCMFGFDEQGADADEIIEEVPEAETVLYMLE